MIYSGTRAAKHLHKIRPFEHLYGGVADALADFNVDKKVWQPDQEADQSYYGCVGYTSADYFADLTGQHFSPDFSLAAAKYLAGEPPTAHGTSFHAGLDARVGMGGLLLTMAGSLNAYHNGEDTSEDWAQWDDDKKKLAHKYDQNGTRNVLGNGDAFNSIIAACHQTGLAVSIGSPWIFKDPSEPFAGSWTNWNPDGTCPTPNFSSPYNLFPWHSYAAKGKKTINGVPYLIIKWWGGTRGDNGFVYWNRETINGLMNIPGAGSLTIDPDATRWVSLMGLLVSRFPNVKPLVPQLLTLKHG